MRLQVSVELVSADYSIGPEHANASEVILSRANDTSIAHQLAQVLFEDTGYNTNVRPVKQLKTITEVNNYICK